MQSKRPGIRARLSYLFDKAMAKGTIALVALLFTITAAVVVFAGVLGALLHGDASAGVTIWQSMMHALDAGTLAGDDTGNIGYLIVMSVVTVCGIFVTSILIGIISAGFEQKLYDLRKGASKVVETGHVVIMGFSDGVYTILAELIEAGANQKRNCIVVMGEQEKETMEELIKGHIKDCKTTEIIVKSGKLTEEFLLERASLETSRSIIVNQQQDFDVIKTILAAVSYLKTHNAFEGGPHITAMIHHKENLDVARIAGEGLAEVLFFQDALSRIIAHTCRQPGLSLVLTEFFDFSGDEFYFESFPELAGRTFGDTLNLFERSTVVGVQHEDKVMLNPPMDLVLGHSDLVVHLAEDDNTSKPNKAVPEMDLPSVSVENGPEDEKSRVLVLGCNQYLPDILTELDHYAERGTTITVADVTLPQPLFADSYINIQLNPIECDIFQRSVLESLLIDGAENILLLSDLQCENDEADAKTLMLLIQLRDIERKSGSQFNLTSEMRSVDNQKLATVANVNDFVVGSTITNLIIAQVSQNRKLSLLFEDMLDADGSELYMKKASRYVQPGMVTNFYTITEIARRRNEIAIGYKRVSDEGIQIKTNPKKSDLVQFGEADYLIVIAQDDC